MPSASASPADGLAPERADLEQETAALVRCLSPALASVLTRRLDGVVWRVAQAAAALGGSSSVPAGQASSLQARIVASIVASVSSGGGPRLLPPAARAAMWLLDADDWRSLAGGATAAAAAREADYYEQGSAAAGASAGGASGAKGGRESLDNLKAKKSKKSKGAAFARGTRVSAAGIRALAVIVARFQSPSQRPLVESLASIPPPTLVSIARSPWGSRHLLEPVVSLSGAKLGWISQRVGRSLRTVWAELAQDRMSAWVVSRAFEQGDARAKERIASALLPAARTLQGSPFGRKIALSIKLDHFASHKASWKAAVQQSERKSQGLRSLLDDVERVVASAKHGAAGGGAAPPTADPARMHPHKKDEKSDEKGGQRDGDDDAEDEDEHEEPHDEVNEDEDDEGDEGDDADEHGKEIDDRDGRPSQTATMLQHRGHAAISASRSPAAAAAAVADSTGDDDSDSTDDDDDDDDDGAAARASTVVAGLGAAQADPFASSLRATAASTMQRRLELDAAEPSDSSSDDGEDGDSEDGKDRDETPKKPDIDTSKRRAKAGEAIRKSLELVRAARTPRPSSGADDGSGGAGAAVGARTAVPLAFLFGGTAPAAAISTKSNTKRSSSKGMAAEAAAPKPPTTKPAVCDKAAERLHKKAGQRTKSSRREEAALKEPRQNKLKHKGGKRSSNAT